MIVYLSGGITGKTRSRAGNWRMLVSKELVEAGFGVLNPLRGGSYLSTQANDVPLGLSDKALKQRDKLDVKTCDIILANFSGAERVSIGSLMEIAWAEELGKLIVVVMDERGFHDHPFVREVAIVFHDLREATSYIVSCQEGLA
jgi:hypothetical protein